MINYIDKRGVLIMLRLRKGLYQNWVSALLGWFRKLYRRLRIIFLLERTIKSRSVGKVIELLQDYKVSGSSILLNRALSRELSRDYDVASEIIIELLIKAGAKCKSSAFLIEKAIESRNVEKVIELLQDYKVSGSSILNRALSRELSRDYDLKSEMIIELLIAAGAKCKSSTFLIERTIKSRNVEKVRKVLRDYEVSGRRLTKILFREMQEYYKEKNSEEIIKLLVKAGADLNMKSPDGETVLDLACLRCFNLKIIESENRYGRIVPSIGYSSFYKVEIIQFLIEEGGIDVNMRNDFGFTPLLKVVNFAEPCFQGRDDFKELLTLLIQAGAEIDGISPYKSGKRAALHYAVCNGLVDIVKLLIEAGADVNKMSDWGTPLYLAAKGGHTIMVKLLIEAGAKVNMQQENGRTALHASIKECCDWDRQEEIIKLLIGAGAEVNIQNKAGESALKLAIMNIDSKCRFLGAESLIEAGATITSELKEELKQGNFFLHSNIRVTPIICMKDLLRNNDNLQSVRVEYYPNFYYDLCLENFLQNIDDLGKEPLALSQICKNKICKTISESEKVENLLFAVKELLAYPYPVKLVKYLCGCWYDNFISEVYDKQRVGANKTIDGDLPPCKLSDIGEKQLVVDGNDKYAAA